MPNPGKPAPEPATEQDARRIGNIRSKRQVGEYKTDTENAKKETLIPRLARASADRVPEPKKYIPGSEYHPIETPEKGGKKALMKRSQSFLQSKITPVQNQPVVNSRDPRKIANSANKPVTGNTIESRRSVNYKPYTLREYKDKVNQDEPFTYKMRGGLGADLGGEEWSKENEKRQRMKEFANRVKSQQFQMQTSGMRRTSMTQNPESQEK